MRLGRVTRVTLATILAAVAVVGAILVVAGRGAPAVLAVRDASGTVLAGIPLPDASFTLRYRNSVYESLAEERFVVEGDRMLLRELAADERAVLEEYYSIDGAARPGGPADARPWTARPADHVSLRELAIAATDLGQRALLVEGSPPLDLWRLVEDRRPTVVLGVEPAR
jgi:hypothetical protein